MPDDLAAQLRRCRNIAHVVKQCSRRHASLEPLPARFLTVVARADFFLALIEFFNFGANACCIVRCPSLILNQLRRRLFGLGRFAFARLVKLQVTIQLGEVLVDIANASCEDFLARIEIRNILVSCHVKFAFRPVGGNQGVVAQFLYGHQIGFRLVANPFVVDRFELLRRERCVDLSHDTSLFAHLDHRLLCALRRHGVAVIGHTFFIHTLEERVRRIGRDQCQGKNGKIELGVVAHEIHSLAPYCCRYFSINSSLSCSPDCCRR